MIHINKIIILLGAFLFITFSCTEKFEEINTDPNRIEKISPGTLLNPILYDAASFNTSRSDAFTFQIMQVTVPYPSASGGAHRYDIGEAAGNSTWNTYYGLLANIKEMREASVAAGDPNYEAIALTLNAWIYSLLTDCFGDVPMEEAVRGDEKILQPAFNTQQQIYTTILEDLEKANALFDPTKTMIYGTDLLYGHITDNIKKVNHWKRFCNSLHLRLLLRVSKREEMNATAKLAAMIGDPAKYPVFASNDEAAILKISGVVPNVSPWGRAIDFVNSKAGTDFFLTNLNNFNDPRRALFYTQAKAKTGNTPIGFKGIPSGYAGSDSQFDFVPSGVNIALVTAPMISVIMTYAEVEFIKAELAQKGLTSGDAKTHYENGVKAAITQWGATVPADYFKNTFTEYNGSFEQIMLQKYFALYFNDYQQWFEYRRTGLPVLPKGDAVLNNKIVPVRFEYPVVVQTNNASNYQKAVEAMGGDDINTKVWWEK